MIDKLWKAVKNISDSGDNGDVMRHFDLGEFKTSENFILNYLGKNNEEINKNKEKYHVIDLVFYITPPEPAKSFINNHGIIKVHIEFYKKFMIKCDTRYISWEAQWLEKYKTAVKVDIRFDNGMLLVWLCNPSDLRQPLDSTVVEKITCEAISNREVVNAKLDEKEKYNTIEPKECYQQTTLLMGKLGNIPMMYKEYTQKYDSSEV